MNDIFVFLKQFTDFRFDIIWEYRDMFFKGALLTLEITAVAVLGGTILGLMGALARIIK